MADFRYPGQELTLFADARNWKRYWSALVRPCIEGRVLEVGAGTGANFQYLLNEKVTSWCFLEPDARLFSRIEAMARALAVPASLRHGTLQCLSALERFDTIIYIDVLEHIGDDRGELQRACRHLDGRGALVVLSPARPDLFSRFDASVGHYRRYTRKALGEAAPGHLEPIVLRYLDAVGLLASLANRHFLRQELPGSRQIRVWDRVMVPLSRRIDPLCGYRWGKSVLGIWRPRQSPGAPLRARSSSLPDTR